MLYYSIAIIFGVIAAFMGMLSECVAGNILHVKNGRKPNAGAAIFPTIPTLSFIAVGIAWFLSIIFRSYALYALIALFLLATIGWAVEFKKLKSEFKRVTEDQARKASS